MGQRWRSPRRWIGRRRLIAGGVLCSGRRRSWRTLAGPRGERRLICRAPRWSASPERRGLATGTLVAVGVVGSARGLGYERGSVIEMVYIISTMFAPPGEQPRFGTRPSRHSA